MSRTIDDRVVKMSFDNTHFEQNVKQSISTLDKLKASLDFSKSQEASAKAFQKMQNAISNFDFSALSKAVDTVNNRFSVLGEAGARVVQRITDTAMNATKSLINAVKQPLVQGGIERAMNIEQATFMLKGLGLDVEAIKQNAMDAVDGTAYGFDEAAKVAAQFGASGMKAGDQMYHSLLGVAGAAAMTGRSFADIGDIFTTVASNGKLMTMQLRQFSASGLNISATLAKALGKTEEQINDMVSKGKISFEMFADAMYEAFGEHAQSANETFQGALSNMKAALKQIGQAVALPSLDNFRLMFLDIRKFIKALQPKLTIVESTLVDIIKFGTQAISALFNGIDDQAVSKVIMGVWQPLNWLLVNLQRFEKFLKSADFTRLLGKFKIAFIALKATVDSYVKPLKDAFIDVFGDLFKSLDTPYDALTKLITKFIEVVRWFRLTDEHGANVKETFKSIFEVIRYGIGALTQYQDVFNEWATSVGNIFGNFISGQTRLNEWIAEVFESIQNGTKKIYELIPGGKAVVDFFRDFAKDIATFVTNVLKLGEELTHTFATSFTLDTLVDIVKAGVFTTFVDTVTSGFTAIANAFTKSQHSIDSIYKSINSVLALPQKLAGVLDSVRLALLAWQNELKSKALMEIGKAMVALGVGLVLIASVDSDKMEAAVSAMMTIVYGVTGAMTLLSKLTTPDLDFSRESGIFAIYFGIQNILNALSTVLTASALYVTLMAMKQLAYSMVVIAVALKILAAMSWDEIGRGLTALAGALTEFLGAMYVVKLIDPAGVETKGIMKLAVTMFVMGLSLRSLASLEWEGIAKGLIGMAGAMGALLLFLKLLGGSEFSSGLMINNKGLLAMKEGKSPIDMGTAFSFVILAGALELIALELKQIGQMDPDQLGQGILVMTIMLTELGVFAKVLDSEKTDYKGIQKALSLIVVAVALEVVIDAFQKILGILQGVNPEDEHKIGETLELMALFIVALGGVLIALEKFKVDPAGAIANAGAILVVSLALGKIAEALTLVDQMNPDNVLKATIVMGLIVAELCVILERLSKSKGNPLVGAASLVILSGALVGIAIALQMVSVLGPAALIGMVALGGLLGVITVIGAHITLDMVTRIQLMAAALFQMSVSIMMIGAAVALPIVAIGYLIDALARLQNAINGQPEAVQQLADSIEAPLTAALRAILNNIEGMLVDLMNNLMTILTTFFDNAEVIIPQFLGMLELIITEIIKVLSNTSDPFLNVIEDIALKLLDKLNNLIDPFVDVAAHLVQAFLDFFTKIIPDLMDALGAAVNALLIALIVWVPIWLDSATLALVAFIQGFADAILNHQAEIQNAVSDAVLAIMILIPRIMLGAISGIVRAGAQLFGEGGLIAGIKSKLAVIKVWAAKIIVTIVSKIEEGKAKLRQAAANIIMGLVNGIMNQLHKVVEAGAKIGETILNAAKNFLGIKSPSREFIKVGMYIDQGLADGIQRNGHIPEDAMLTVAGHLVSIMGGTLDRIEEMVEETKIDPNFLPKLSFGENYAMGLYMASDAYKDNVESLKEVDDEHKKLEKELKDLNNEYTDYRGSVNYLGDAYEDIYLDIGAVRTGLQALRDEHSALNTEYDTLQGEIDGLEKQLKDYEGQLGKATGAARKTLETQIAETHQLIALRKARQGEINTRWSQLNVEEKRWEKQESYLDQTNRSLEQLKQDRKVAAEWIYDYETQLEALQNQYDAQDKAYQEAEKTQKELSDILKEADDLRKKEKRTAEENAELAKLEARITQENIRVREEEARAMMHVTSVTKDQLQAEMDSTKAILDNLKEEQDNRENNIEHQEKLLDDINKKEEEIAENRKKREEAVKKMREEALKALKEERDAIAKIVSDTLKLSKMSLDTHINLTNGFSKAAIKFFDGFEAAKDILGSFETAEKNLISSFQKTEYNEKWETAPNEAQNMVDHMLKQLSNEEEFEKQLNELLVKKVDSALVDQLRALGAGSDQLKAFLDMNDSQIKDANAAFAKTQKKAVKDMLDSMKKEVYGDTDFEDQLSELLGKSVEEGLVEQLRALGAGSDQLKAFLRMEEADIAEANRIFRDSEEKNIEKMLENMRKQITSDAEFEAQLATLMENGFDKGLVEEIRALGAGSDELALFLKMSAEQRDEANAMYVESQKKNAELMIENMEKQFTDVLDWEGKILKLHEMNFSKGVIEMIKNLGVGSEELEAYLQMDEEQVKRTNELFMDNEKKKSETLITSIKQQRIALLEWRDSLKALENRNVSKALLQELVEAGPESQELLQAITNMTEEELAELNSLYADTFDFSDGIAGEIQASYALAESKAGEFDAIGRMMTSAVIKGITDSVPELEEQTSEMILEAYVSACESLGYLATGTTISDLLMGGLDVATPEALDGGGYVGTALMAAMVDSMAISAPQVDDEAVMVVEGASDEAFVASRSFKSVGANMCAGMANGLMSSESIVTGASRRVARSAYAAAMAELQIHSPSRLFAGLGEYVDLGFAKGIDDKSRYVSSAVVGMGTNALNNLRDTISEVNAIVRDTITDPVIRPTLDTSDISRKAAMIGSMFENRRLGVSVSGDGSDSNLANGTNVTFNQYNTSPKALSRTEIYRQTNNQLSQIRRALG